MADPQADIVKSPIIMTVDSPEEDKDKEENEDNERTENNINNQVCSPSLARPILASPRFGIVNPFAPKTNTLLSPSTVGNKMLLRPSQLGQSSKGFTLNPSKLNPFAKPAPPEDTAKKSVTQNGEAPKFVPLLVTEKAKDTKSVANSIPQTKTNHGFVFGQNLQERVIGDTHDEPKASTSVSTNGSSNNDMLFSSAIKDAPVTESLGPSKSLSESAREYEELRANKRKYEEVEVKTGEEDETNIAHISCKLFAFDKSVGTWQERGRGNLRLNDQQIKEDGKTYIQSRLVFRTSGVLRVILNTKIWAEMTIEQASAKSIRFTAMDSTGEIKVFLVMATPDEAKVLYKCLQERLLSEQKRQNMKRVNNNKDAEVTTEESK